MRFSLGVVSWMILIYSFSAHSISYVCNGPVDLLTNRFPLNRRIPPVILSSFLYVNLLIMLVIKWLWLGSLAAMVTINLSLIFNVFTCVSLVPTTSGCVGQSSSLPSQLGPSCRNLVNLSALIPLVPRSLRFSLVLTYFQSPFDNVLLPFTFLPCRPSSCMIWSDSSPMIQVCLIAALPA